LLAADSVIVIGSLDDNPAAKCAAALPTGGASATASNDVSASAETIERFAQPTSDPEVLQSGEVALSRRTLDEYID